VLHHPPAQWASSQTKVASNTWFSVCASQLAPRQQPGSAPPLNIGEAIRTHHIKKLQVKAAKKPKAGPETHLHGGKVYDNPVRVRRIRIYPTSEQKSLLVG